jgi:hypothetical protein
MPNQYYLANQRDTMRLATTGEIEAAHDCQPWYFSSIAAAEQHPAAATLFIHEVPIAETVPGLPKGAVCAAEVYAAIQSAALEAAALCRL